MLPSELARRGLQTGCGIQLCSHCRWHMLNMVDKDLRIGTFLNCKRTSHMQGHIYGGGRTGPNPLQKAK